jgi:hypothetical protein
MTASDARSPAEPFVGLSAEDEERPAGSFLQSIAWDGEEPDPDVWRAEDFLALL